MLKELIKNPWFIASLATVGGMFWKTLTGLPSRIYEKVRSWFSVILDVRDDEYNYTDVKEWVSRQQPVLKIRKFGLMNFRLVQGSGTFLYQWHGTYFFCTRVIKEGGENGSLKKFIETLTIRFMTRNPDLLKDIVQEIKSISNGQQESHIRVGRPTHGGYPTRYDKVKRPPNTVFHPAFRILEKDIRSFLTKKEWYERHGIPYHRGYLLHGPPGTGKTSIVHALASLFNLPVNVCSLRSIDISGHGQRIILIEDVDRELKESKDNIEGPVSLAELLNMLDGFATPEDVIFILTTNNPEVLPEAMIRPGRIDQKIEVGYLGQQDIEQYLKAFFSNGHKTLEEELLPLAGTITGAQVQQALFSNECNP